MYKFSNFPNFSIYRTTFKKVDIDNNLNIFSSVGHCWSTPTPCGHIENLNINISKARHDLFNLILDMNGIHSADDAQRSLEYLEESASILKSMKNSVNHD